MQVTCPNCGARYAVDPLAIGPIGRTVQCVRCSHRWFEKVKVTPAASVTSPTGEPPVPDFVIRPQSHYRAGLPAIATPRRTVHWGRWIAALVMLVLVVGAAVFAYREEIRNSLSGWSAILSFNPARGLIASPAKTTPLFVRGELINNGRAAGSTSTLVPGERAYPPDGASHIVPTVE